MARISPYISLAARHAEHGVPFVGCPICMRARPARPVRAEKPLARPRAAA